MFSLLLDVLIPHIWNISLKNFVVMFIGCILTLRFGEGENWRGEEEGGGGGEREGFP